MLLLLLLVTLDCLFVLGTTLVMNVLLWVLWGEAEVWSSYPFPDRVPCEAPYWSEMEAMEDTLGGGGPKSTTWAEDTASWFRLQGTEAASRWLLCILG